MRDNKSSTSLFGTECGRIKRRENLIQPQINSKILIGIKYKTKKLKINNATANQLNSGTEKLNVL